MKLEFKYCCRRCGLYKSHTAQEAMEGDEVTLHGREYRFETPYGVSEHPRLGGGDVWGLIEVSDDPHPSTITILYNRGLNPEWDGYDSFIEVLACRVPWRPGND